jgi:hypothetical protein
VAPRSPSGGRVGGLAKKAHSSPPRRKVCGVCVAITRTISAPVQAARFREQYGVNRIFLATDNKEAAALCDAGVLGFECRHIGMDRSKFESATFIEKRVEQHEEGALSGSTVAL